VQIMLLAGADLLETFSQPGVWSPPDLNHMYVSPHAQFYICYLCVRTSLIRVSGHADYVIVSFGIILWAIQC
jgi:hypothetical protein